MSFQNTQKCFKIPEPLLNFLEKIFDINDGDLSLLNEYQLLLDIQSRKKVYLVVIGPENDAVWRKKVEFSDFVKKGFFDVMKLNQGVFDEDDDN